MASNGNIRVVDRDSGATLEGGRAAAAIVAGLRAIATRFGRLLGSAAGHP